MKAIQTKKSVSLTIFDKVALKLNCATKLWLIIPADQCSKIYFQTLRCSITTSDRVDWVRTVVNGEVRDKSSAFRTKCPHRAWNVFIGIINHSVRNDPGSSVRSSNDHAVISHGRLYHAGSMTTCLGLPLEPLSKCLRLFKSVHLSLTEDTVQIFQKAFQKEMLPRFSDIPRRGANIGVFRVAERLWWIIREQGRVVDVGVKGSWTGYLSGCVGGRGGKGGGWLKGVNVESLLFETYQRLFRLAESRFSSSVAPPLLPRGGVFRIRGMARFGGGNKGVAYIHIIYIHGSGEGRGLVGGMKVLHTCTYTYT